MITVEKLRQFGANTEEGLTRCMGNEPFYLRMVGKCLEDASFDRLCQAMEQGSVREAFEAAHALKGVLGNLSLTPLFEPVAQLTELLRAGSLAGTQPLLQTVTDKRGELLRMNEEG